ncbi:hypothetical protein [Paraburkholderia diazotrophica]|uniref:hypothetical protein n=1 Tax=Paraburkholderia diazotrophica TaxID=667676 RepID=UPI003175C86D
MLFCAPGQSPLHGPTRKPYINPLAELYLARHKAVNVPGLARIPQPGKKCVDAAWIFSQEPHDFAVAIYGHLRAS